MRNKLATAAIAALFCTLSFGAHADTLSDLFTQGTVDGQLRVYDFNRDYGVQTAAKPNAQAFSAAILLNAKTASLYGFSLGASLVSANSFETQSDNVKEIDSTLMGPGNSLTALSQAYLQYQNSWVLLKGGYQYIDTPWLGSMDGRVIPASYDALTADFKPLAGWDIVALRTFGWKSRTSDNYFDDNLYYPTTYHGDSLYAGNAPLPATAPSAPGTWALGSTYVNGGLKVQGWYYDFMDFAHMGYADGSYVFNTGTGFNPVIGAQLLTETGGSDNTLVDTQAKLLGVAGDDVKSRAWGADLGLVIPNGRFDVYYNKLSQEDGAVGDGAIISPYTVGWSTDPLYTTSMIRGLVEAGPGHAWKAKAAYDFFGSKLQLVAAYAKYTTDLFGDSHDTYFDIIYNFDGYLKGLQLRYRWELSSGGTGNLNPGNGSFTYNRVMLSYKF
ncbi:hypothetical protein [Rhodanobacter sp. C01]|uniref:hypothetical protein n=1 Tax=Rhodanobacter sp. C01 TaxID=1945856 RepID=UPI0009852C1E|nr:hypothetical protein [Rhodanobacter sp. C01]